MHRHRLDGEWGSKLGQTLEDEALLPEHHERRRAEDSDDVVELAWDERTQDRENEEPNGQKEEHEAEVHEVDRVVLKFRLDVRQLEQKIEYQQCQQTSV